MNNHNVHTLPVKRMPDNLTPNSLCVLQNIQGNPSSWSYPHFLGGIHVVTTSLGFAAMSRVQGRLHLDPSSRSVGRSLTGAICEVPGVGPKKQREKLKCLGLKRSMSIALLVADPEKMVWEPQHEVLIFVKVKIFSSKRNHLITYLLKKDV